MTEEEHKAIVVAIGRLFRELPTLRSQVDVLGALTGFLKEQPKNKQVKNWLYEAEGCLKGSAIIMKNDDSEDGEKV